MASRANSSAVLLADGRGLLDRRRVRLLRDCGDDDCRRGRAGGTFVQDERGKRTDRGKLFRGLLLCASLAVSLLLAEAATALWVRFAHSGSAVPAGGLRAASGSGHSDFTPGATPEVAAPERFAEKADDHDIDIAVVGESSAEGVPFNQWTSIGRILTWQLEPIFPGRAVRLQVLAFSGHTLESQQALLPQLARRPEILIIYCGHNEFSARVNPTRDTRHYFDEQLPDALDRRGRTDRGILSSMRSDPANGRQVPRRDSTPEHGNRALVDVPAYTTKEYTALLVDFRRRLEAMVAYAERIGALRGVDLAPRERLWIRAESLVPARGDAAPGARSIRPRLSGRAAQGGR